MTALTALPNVLSSKQNSPSAASGPALRIVIVGHVDHGKSTLIGRLFFDTGRIPRERQEEIERTCREQGRPFELAYLMDALEEEREQNVTIDTTQSRFASSRRPYVIIDAPGHREFLKNMVTGASEADAALLIVDGVEGVREQTRRHAYLLALLGVRRVIGVINKLDTLGFDRARFDAVEEETRHFLRSVGVDAQYVIPISARQGDNVVRRSQATPWYEGPTVLEALDAFEAVTGDGDRPLRLPIQDVYRWDELRRYVGRIEGGVLRRGDPVRFLPSGRTSRVRTIERWPSAGETEARAGLCVGVTLTDEVFVEPGEVLARQGDEPERATELTASLFWMGRSPIAVGDVVGFKIGTADAIATVVALEERIDSTTLEVVERYAERLAECEVGRVVLRLDRPIAADRFDVNPRLGRFVLVSAGVVSGGGIVRELRDERGAGVRTVRLDGLLATDATGVVIDLRAEAGELDLVAGDGLLARLGSGERLTVLVSGLTPLRALVRWAYEHFVSFECNRELEGARVILRGRRLGTASEQFTAGPGI